MEDRVFELKRRFDAWLDNLNETAKIIMPEDVKGILITKDYGTMCIRDLTSANTTQMIIELIKKEFRDKESNR